MSSMKMQLTNRSTAPGASFKFDCCKAHRFFQEKILRGMQLQANIAMIPCPSHMHRRIQGLSNTSSGKLKIRMLGGSSTCT
jgi:hypothetical protein